MRTNGYSATLTTVLVSFALTMLIAGTHASAQTEKLLYSFNNNGTDGNEPGGALVFDAHGNLYGATTLGGSYLAGTVFELAPAAGGGWQEKILHTFNGSLGPPPDSGQNPEAGLIIDSAGNLYGTTYYGGSHDLGTAFELTHKTGGGWPETILYSLQSGESGQCPVGGLVLDSTGRLYGTTSDRLCGGQSKGVVFELAPKTGGGWSKKTLHHFDNTPNDGTFPTAGLVLDKAGNLYGTTTEGGTSTNCASGCGTVFELSRGAGGVWTETILYNFTSGTDGYYPASGVVIDAAGNLYGTANGSTYGDGTVFELSPATGGGWTETTLHIFNHNNKDGSLPNGVVLNAGNLYGTTQQGGTLAEGTVFELSPATGGGWTETVLHNFVDKNNDDGTYPVSSVIFDSAGNLYGTTTSGGTYGAGTVFEITP